jgi:hypothetical protein
MGVPVVAPVVAPVVDVAPAAPEVLPAMPDVPAGDPIVPALVPPAVPAPSPVSDRAALSLPELHAATPTTTVSAAIAVRTRECISKSPCVGCPEWAQTWGQHGR